jgi:hypothetical protein
LDLDAALPKTIHLGQDDQDGRDGHDISDLAVELVEIALGRCPEDEMYFWKYQQENKHEERPKDKKNYEFYSLMFIKWENGIAYRQRPG